MTRGSTEPGERGEGDPRNVLETPRLRLRRFVPADAAFVATMFEDDDARRFYPDMHRLENAQRWIRRNLERYPLDGFGLWLAELRETGEPVGDCGLMRQPVEGREEIEVGYHLHARFRGRGLATEAASACMRFGFDDLGFDRIVSLVHPANLASHAVARRLHGRVRRCARHGIDYFLYYTDRREREASAQPTAGPAVAPARERRRQRIPGGTARRAPPAP